VTTGTDRRYLTPLEAFNERAQYVQVVWSRSLQTYEVIDFNGKVLYKSPKVRQAVAAAEEYENA